MSRPQEPGTTEQEDRPPGDESGDNRPLDDVQLARLVSEVGHDFTNVLAVVSLQAKRLQRALADRPDLLRSATQIGQAGERGVALCNKLLEAIRPPRSGTQTGNAPNQKPMILVVSNDATLRRAVRDSLPAGRYRVAEASGAAQALSRAVNSEAPPDLVISDASLPGGSGARLAEQLRNQGLDAPLLQVTAADESLPNGSPAMRLPETVLQVPACAEELARRVAEALARRGT